MTLTLYFLRHGQTVMSRDDILCGCGVDPDLTSEGAQMAREFGEAYRAFPFEAIFCSPLRRTLATAQPISELRGLVPEIREDLKEMDYGKWEGLCRREVMQKYHDDYLRWEADPAWYPPTGGETADALARRALRVVEEIKRRFEKGAILVVSHKATIRALLCALFGIDVCRFRHRFDCPVASLSVIEFGNHGPLMRALADRSHLSEQMRMLK
ncbi:MAG TPA: histidine phosphatase family protein [Chthoniobacterales bacterium]